jgi:mono/diheme cytochrome c family protein
LPVTIFQTYRYDFFPYPQTDQVFKHKRGDFMRTNLRMIAVGMLATTLVFAVIITAASAPGIQEPSDTAAYYTAKCVMCHGKKAEKKFDTALSDDQLVEIILKGKKAEKPPHMPAYADKGVTAEHAKALVAHMKQLKATP